MKKLEIKQVPPKAWQTGIEVTDFGIEIRSEMTREDFEAYKKEMGITSPKST